jgi:hypothetical protein
MPKKHTRKHKSKKMVTSMRSYFKCIEKENKKQLTKKEYKRVKGIQKKITYNAKLKAPEIIIKINKNILKRKSKLPSTAISVAHRMIATAKKDIKKNKKKTQKKISAEEMALLKRYHNDLTKKIKHNC